jgi:hypothetical protein
VSDHGRLVAVRDLHRTQSLRRLTVIEYEDDAAPAKGDLRKLTADWIERHPHVFAMFERYACDMANKGRFFGINLLRERVRWECAYNYANDDFKFCNSFSPYVARELVRKHPGLAKHMRFRRTKYEKAAVCAE